MAITLSDIVNSYSMLKLGLTVFVASKIAEYTTRPVAVYPSNVAEEKSLISEKPVPKDYAYA